MNTLTAARAQMEISLAFHMVFAALGIGLPLLLVIAEGLWLRTGRAHYLVLARRWSKATGLLFVVGAVSGTALSFELGLLWPGFMSFAGPLIGPVFTLEGFAFFIEAIFLGIYLYGWDRVSPRAHWLAGVVVAVSGMLSGLVVIAANAWMQQPTGFHLVAGHMVDVDPLAPFRARAWRVMGLHSTLSSYAATGFAAAGVYALAMLRGRRDDYHRAGLRIALAVASCALLLQLPSGHASAQLVASTQPVKLAAMEAHFDTARDVPETLGGWPDVRTGTVRFAVRIPYMLSVLATDDPHAEIRGLRAFPRDLWPNVVVTHVAFQLMVACGMALAGLSVLFLFLRWRRRDDWVWLLRAAVMCAPLGFVALEAGWFVTEVGRQPWIIQGIMRTRDAVTTVPHAGAVFWAFGVLYVGMGIVLVSLLRGLARIPIGALPATSVTEAPALPADGRAREDSDVR